MAEMAVELVAVERRLWSGKASFVFARTTEGEIGILPGHEPMLAQLEEAGIVRIDGVDGPSTTVAVHGGFLSSRRRRSRSSPSRPRWARRSTSRRARKALERADESRARGRGGREAGPRCGCEPPARPSSSGGRRWD